jgi:hypothetical protein
MEMLEHLILECLWVRETERVPTWTATPPTAVDGNWTPTSDDELLRIQTRGR